MEDKRNLTMGLQFSVADSIKQLSSILDAIGLMKSGFQDAEDSADRFGSNALRGAGALEKGMENAGKETARASTLLKRVSNSGDAARSSLAGTRREFDRMGDEAEGASRDAREGLRRLSESAIGLRADIEDAGEAAEDSLDNAEASAASARSALKEIRGSGEEAGNAYQELGMQAKGAGEAAVDGTNEAIGSIKETSSRAKGLAGTIGEIGVTAKGALGDAASSADSAGAAINRTKEAGEEVEDTYHRIGTQAKKAGEAAVDGANEATDAIEETSRKAQDLSKDLKAAEETAEASMVDAKAAASRASNGLRQVSDDGNDLQSTYRNLGAEAGSFGAAAAKAAGTALKETNSFTAALKAGVQGAYGYAEKQSEKFFKKAKTGFETVDRAVKHPIQTLKGGLSNALEKAGSKIRDVEDDAEDAEKGLKDMGDGGESAGTRIKDAVGSAVTSFFAISAAIEIVKSGIEVMKNFGSSILNAGIEAEKTGKKFGAMFSEDSGVGEWADNFAGAIHRSETEVQSFLVSNKAMYQELGITGQAADELSKITTSLAYDLGSAFSMEDAEALAVMQDYLRGNTDAVAEYGIRIDDAVLKQSALSMGLGSNIDSLNDAAMAQVRMNALLENSTAIQQAAAKEQKGYANGIKSLKGIWSDFLTSAGEKFAPVFENLTNTILTSWPQIEPALMGIVDLMGSGLSVGIPVIADLAMNSLPALVQSLGAVFAAAAPLGSVFLDFATTALPPLAAAITPLVETFSGFAQTVLPPLSRVISNIAQTVMPPLVEILQSLNNNVIAPLMPHIESIANAILPAVAGGLQMISPLLEIVSPVLGGIADILSRVVDFAGRLVGWLEGGLGSALNKIAGLFGGGGSSSVGTQIPHNADGDPNFPGGWTHINERGGEIAYLPSGSTIIPADKSEQIINNGQKKTITISAPFHMELVININGNPDDSLIAQLEERIKQAVKEAHEEWTEETEMKLAIQLGNA